MLEAAQIAARTGLPETFRVPPPAAPAPLPERVAPAGDPVSLAVQRGLAVGLGRTRPDADLLARAAALVAQARDGGGADALPEILGLVATHPACERLQVLGGRLVEGRAQEGGEAAEREAAAVWGGIHARFPQAAEPFRLTLRWTARHLGRDAALDRLKARYPAPPRDPADLLLYAWGQEELRCHDAADAAFGRLIALGKDEGLYLQFAQVLSKRGEIWRACAVLDGGLDRCGATPRLVRARAAAQAERRRLAAFVPVQRHERASNAVLATIFDRLAAERVPERRTRRRVGRTMLVTGSLGAGGAERQFALTARGLQAAVTDRRPIAGHAVAGPVEVVCRSLRARPGGDFFAPGLREAGVAIGEYAAFAPYAGRADRSVVTPYADGLPFLPAQIAEGTTRLADAIRARAPHVVHIWQDGSIYAAGLAALMARVPRIVLNVRSLPPIDRPDRYRPEYEVIFRALLAAPGVRLTANSHAAARRYAEWLAFDPARIAVVYNGVDALPAAGAAADLEAARRFEAATPDADFTLGTVMRLDENKRPFLWLDAAACLLRAHPRARFVVVGDGPLRASSEERARRLGIAERVLFAGRSHHVGFWLARMDAFMLLSLIEGLPNVLVEAQHAGLPVIATDVGGSSETVRAGKTGLLLPAGPDLSAEAVAACVASLKADPARRTAMGAAARRWARQTFSVETMMAETVRTFLV